MIRRWLIKLGKFLARDEFHWLEQSSNMRAKKIDDLERDISDIRNIHAASIEHNKRLLLELGKLRSHVHPWEAARHHAAKQSYREHIDALRKTIYRIVKDDHLLPRSTIYSEPLHELLCLQDNEMSDWVKRNG